jgi:hypothetical protein
MHSSQHHPVAGVAAFGFDESANGVLEALAGRVKQFERPLLCRAANPASFADDLSSAISALLSPQSASVEQVDHVHVLIVVDPQHEEHPEIIDAICSTIFATRRRFQARLGRAILVVRGSFQPVTSATHGRVRALPRRGDSRGRTGVDAFDLVVLLDSQKADGSPSLTPASAADSHASALANLLLSDFEESIYKLLEHQRGPLGAHGLFVSIGVAELPFSSQETVQSIAAVLWRRMALKLVQSGTPQSPKEHGETWKEDVEDRLTAEPLESADPFWVDKFHRLGAEKLQRGFEESAYQPGILLRSLAEREEYLIRFRDRARTRLTAFMDEFVPRYSPALPRAPEVLITSRREYGWIRLATLLVCMMAILAVLVGNAIAASATLRFPALLVALLTAVALMYWRTRRVTEETTKEVQVPVPSPSPLPRDVIAELRHHRVCGEIASAILKRHRRLRKSIEADIESLQSDLNKTASVKTSAVMTLPETLIDELLIANALDADQVLTEFWQQGDEQLTARPGAREKSLSLRLRRYAASRCGVFASLRMNDILAYLGGSAALDRAQVAREIDRLHVASNPWMPVEGFAAGMVVALPESLSPELRQSIAERFQDPVFVVPTKRESIVALQWTQGYVQGAVGQNPKAMAL